MGLPGILCRYRATPRESYEDIVQARAIRRDLVARRCSFDRAMSLCVDALLDLERESRVVGIVMAFPADFEDHAGIAFVSEGEDRAKALRGLTDVVSSRPVAGLASDACQIGLGGDGCLWRKTSGLAVSRRMACETISIFGTVGPTCVL